LFDNRIIGTKIGTKQKNRSNGEENKENRAILNRQLSDGKIKQLEKK